MDVNISDTISNSPLSSKYDDENDWKGSSSENTRLANKRNINLPVGAFGAKLCKISHKRQPECAKKSVSSDHISTSNLKKPISFLRILDMHSLFSSFPYMVTESCILQNVPFPIENFLPISHLPIHNVANDQIATRRRFSTAGYVVKYIPPASTAQSHSSKPSKLLLIIEDGNGCECEVNLFSSCRDSLACVEVTAGSFVFLHNVRIFRKHDAKYALIGQFDAKSKRPMYVLGQCSEYGICTFSGGCSNSYFRYGGLLTCRKQSKLCAEHFSQRTLNLRATRPEFSYGYGTVDK